MFRKFICVLVCNVFALLATGQELKPTVIYMQSPQVSQIAKDVHAGKVVPSHNEQIYTIADSMSTDNTETRPFYIFLVSKMLLTTKDWKLRVELGKYCRRYIQNTPDPAIELLFSKTVKPDYKYLWAKVIAENIDANCKTTLVKCFKESRLLALEMCKAQNKDRLESFYIQVRSELDIHH